MDEARSGEALLGLPVRLHGVQLGQAVDVILASETLRAVGLEVQCGDDALRLLPHAAAKVGEHEVTLDSALLLLEEIERTFYHRRTRSLRALRGSPVTRDRRPVGTLADVILGRDGEVVALAVAGPEGTQRLPFDESVKILDRDAASAA